tara:strand:+ start:1469 stop:1642 length:174 start_codon:yes stop_codon:yes gene_type:complete
MSNTSERIKEYLYLTGAKDFTVKDLQEFYEERFQLENEQIAIGIGIEREGQRVFRCG